MDEKSISKQNVANRLITRRATVTWSHRSLLNGIDVAGFLDIKKKRHQVLNPGEKERVHYL